MQVKLARRLQSIFGFKYYISEVTPKIALVSLTAPTLAVNQMLEVRVECALLPFFFLGLRMKTEY